MDQLQHTLRCPVVYGAGKDRQQGEPGHIHLAHRLEIEAKRGSPCVQLLDQHQPQTFRSGGIEIAEQGDDPRGTVVR